MASLLAEPHLEIDGVERPLPAGQMLLMGGDQAYPYASMLEYKRRLLTPFNLTTWHDPLPPAEKPGRRPRKLFILPGNHDWYDGLASFDELFCTRRDGVSNGLRMGHWECQQHRSYWAIELPNDWWIWGLDIQLTASVDVGQVQYFNAVSARLPKDDKTKAKIILCIATPSWHVGDEAGTTEAYSGNLQRILNLAIERARVSVILAGDDHHYARYFNNDHRLNLITSGGGGAYLAPTHQLHNTIRVPWMSSTGHPHLLKFTLNGAPATDDTSVANPRHEPRPQSLFPRRSISQRLSWLVLGFPLWNPTFCFALGFFYWLMGWFYTTASVRPARSPDGTTKRIEDILQRVRLDGARRSHLLPVRRRARAASLRRCRHCLFWRCFTVSRRRQEARRPRGRSRRPLGHPHARHVGAGAGDARAAIRIFRHYATLRLRRPSEGFADPQSGTRLGGHDRRQRVRGRHDHRRSTCFSAAACSRLTPTTVSPRSASWATRTSCACASRPTSSPFIRSGS